jgi:hypothetical protein
MRFNRGAVLVGAAWLLCLIAAAPASAEEYYFLLLFGSQGTPPQPKYSHTFATFVRAVGTGPCLDRYDLYCNTISWLPADRNVRPLAAVPEYGRNFDLDTSLRGVLSSGQRVSLWGPFQVPPWVYWNAVRQQANLELGRMRYKAVDIASRPDRVANCIHAVSRVVCPQRINRINPLYGEAATYLVLQRYRPYLVAEGTKHTWLANRLGLSCYPIVYRDMEAPRSCLVRGRISAQLGTQPAAVPSYGPPVVSCKP